mgnify:CR=1 FL=1
MLEHLGVILDPATLKAFFVHPLDPQNKIYVFLDICRMLKLVRNTLGTGGVFVGHDGNKILWQYFVELWKLHDEEDLSLGNKVKLTHIKWQQQKMKDNLATQTFSTSVADAIEYCSQTLKPQQFRGSEATVKFVRILDRLFDILNSRNPCAKGNKSALRIENKDVCSPFLDEAFKYILALKNPTNAPMHTTRRKTGFVGFLLAIKSTKGIFSQIVEQPEAPLEYLPTDKFSHDHLELFFGAMRSSGGFNNNPTTLQFKAAYKRLLMRSSIKGGKGKYQKRDPTEILCVVTDTCKVNEEVVTINDAAQIRKYDLIHRPVPVENDHDYCEYPNMGNLSEFKKDAVSYIAGYVAKMADKENSL